MFDSHRMSLHHVPVWLRTSGRCLAVVLSAVALVTSFASDALAQHAGDVFPDVQDGRVVTQARVFGSELGELAPNFTDEPGFDALPGTFPVPSSVGFNILDSLRKWNGSDFSTIPSEQLEIDFGPLSSIFTPPTPSVVPGFSLPVGGAGEWHRHLDFTLGSPASSGVYLLQMELFSSDVGLEPSLPFYLVFNQNDTEVNHDAAIEYATSVLVPEPGSLAIAGIGAVALVATVFHRRLKLRRKNA